MSRIALALLPTLIACSSKQATPEAAADASGTAEAATTDAPDDAASKKFVGALMDLEIKDFRPKDAAGAIFEYASMSFNADNTWNASGFVEAQDERMDCAETGTWSMEPAESANTATMTWVVSETDCITRSIGEEVRIKLTITPDGGIKHAFR
ncbi:MAG: hypothetical protein QGG40_18080 [Myxococcota bacterium]|jgi:hypothetical protein|nr:hypothetical protein [Myxococcota bacterium]